MSLTDDDRRMIDFAAKRWNYAGLQAAAVEREFGMSITRYWQRVNQLIDREDALAYSPVVVNRLRRIRSTRASLQQHLPPHVRHSDLDARTPTRSW